MHLTSAEYLIALLSGFYYGLYHRFAINGYGRQFGLNLSGYLEAGGL